MVVTFIALQELFPQLSCFWSWRCLGEFWARISIKTLLFLFGCGVLLGFFLKPWAPFYVSRLLSEKFKISNYEASNASKSDLGIPYCWWKKSCTTWDVWKLVNNGRIIILGGASINSITRKIDIYSFITLFLREKTVGREETLVQNSVLHRESHFYIQMVSVSNDRMPVMT